MTIGALALVSLRSLYCNFDMPDYSETRKCITCIGLVYSFFRGKEPKISRWDTNTHSDMLPVHQHATTQKLLA